MYYIEQKAGLKSVAQTVSHYLNGAFRYAHANAGATEQT